MPMDPERPGQGPWPPPFGDALFRALLDGTQAGVAVLDADLRYRYVNPALARGNGVPVEEHIGRTISEVVPGVNLDEEKLRAVLADGVPRELVSSGQTRADSPHSLRYWQGSYHRVEDAQGRVVGLAGVVLEVSADREIQRDLERARERLLLLDAAAVRIGSTLELNQTCQELVDLMVEVLADGAGVDVLAVAREGRGAPPRGGVRTRRAALALRPELRPHAAAFSYPGEYIDHPPDSFVPRCLESGLPVVQNLLSDEQMVRSVPDADRLAVSRAANIHSALTVPLSARGDQLGAVTLVRAGSSPAFDAEDVAVAGVLADRAAISLDNARRYTREHGIAVELQRALLAAPVSPHPRIEVATRYLPAGATDLVGGDWFDTLPLPGGLCLLAMGDVMGHGVQAAVEMSHYRSMLRVVAGDGDLPGRVLRRMDDVLSAAGAERPATCLLGLADPVRGGAWFASAGHLPPALVTPGGGVQLFDVPPGPPLGADLRGAYESVYVPWPPGHTLLLYTDGLVERRSEDIDNSLARLAGMVLPDAGGPLDAMLAEIVHRLAPAATEDDVAVLAARAVR